MKTKQLIAILLALLAAAALFAGCEKTLELGDGEESTIAMPKNLDDDIVNKALEDIGAEGATLSEAERKALEERLNSEGFSVSVGEDGVPIVQPPEGVTLPVSTNAPSTQPPTMPEGTKVEASEVYKHVKKVQDIFNSKTFYLKGRGTNPMGIDKGFTSMTMAVDQNKLMIETLADWTDVIKSANEGSSKFGQDKVQGAVLQTMFGNKLRMIFSSEGVFWAFPDKKTYVNPSVLMGEEESFNTEEVMKDFNMFGEAYDVPKDVASSKVKVDGKEYLCATLPNEETGEPAVRYYFLKGDLKRIEVFGENTAENSILEIDEFSGKVDANLFSVKDYKALPLSELQKLATVLGGSLA